jgi:hypothetical protein
MDPPETALIARGDSSSETSHGDFNLVRNFADLGMAQLAQTPVVFDERVLPYHGDIF